MHSANIGPTQLKDLFLAGTPLVDVRAPVEYAQGHLPGAVNLPILNDEERALIGTIYKKQGSEAAIAKGYELVSGSVRSSRIQAWFDFFLAYPEASLYCFRGGQRSQITQQWLREMGLDRPLILGGYKRARQFLLQELDRIARDSALLILSGPTGSGKTQLIKMVQSFYPAIDLEGLACHRGSAFGALALPQPSQINFENQLCVSFMRREDAFARGLHTLVEDESRLIGRLSIPESFFVRMRNSKVLWLDEPITVRIQNIFHDYVLTSSIGHSFGGELTGPALEVFSKYKRSLLAIQRKLGGLRTQEILADIERAEGDFLAGKSLESNKVWIEKLLVYYYDPLYLGSLERRQVEVSFKGSTAEALAHLSSLTS